MRMSAIEKTENQQLRTHPKHSVTPRPPSLQNSVDQGRGEVFIWSTNENYLRMPPTKLARCIVQPTRLAAIIGRKPRGGWVFFCVLVHWHHADVRYASSSVILLRDFLSNTTCRLWDQNAFQIEIENNANENPKTLFWFWISNGILDESRLTSSIWGCRRSRRPRINNSERTPNTPSPHDHRHSKIALTRVGGKCSYEAQTKII